MPIASAGNVISSSAQLGADVVLSAAIKDGEIVNVDVGAAAAIALSKLAALTASRALVSSAGGVIEVSLATATEIGYLAGLASKPVANSGNETINGTKTFGTIPELPASNPTTDNQAARKAYVDSKASSVVVPKTADETVTNSTVLQNDDELQFAALANKMYAIQMFIIVNDPNTDADIKWAFSLPAAATMFGKELQVEADAVREITGATLVSDVVDGNDHCMVITGVIKVGANAGNCIFQWCQNAARATGSKVKAGSWLIYTILN